MRLNETVGVEAHPSEHLPGTRLVPRPLEHQPQVVTAITLSLK